jgi:cytochrome P450
VAEEAHRALINPDQFVPLRADPTRARAAFEEAIRLESPAQAFFRTAAPRSAG